MAGGVTGEIHYVDAGYNKVGMPDPKNISLKFYHYANFSLVCSLYYIFYSTINS
jgi:Enoyl-[acyl-carrier-protein] reductase (NADH)